LTVTLSDPTMPPDARASGSIWSGIPEFGPVVDGAPE